MLNKPLYVFGDVKVYGNNHSVPLIYFWELSEEEKKEFDWLENPDENFTGFRYKGNVYSLSEFMKVESYAPDWFKKFDGYYGDSFFSGILVKYNKDETDFIKVYTYIG